MSPNSQSSLINHNSAGFMTTPAKCATVAAPNLAAFQANFGQYLRLQDKGDMSSLLHGEPKPSLTHSDNPNIESQASVFSSIFSTERVTKLYQSLVYNNVRGFLDTCFPVCQTLISEQDWQEVCQQFFLTHRCHSPYFIEINKSFVDYLSQPDQLELLNLPPYFAQLAHYEWVELLVDTFPDPMPEHANEFGPNKESAYSSVLSVNPVVQNLHYQWPVHTISCESPCPAPEDSFFIVYRKTHDVAFMQTNALTYALVEFIKTKDSVAPNATDLKPLLEQFAESIGYDNSATLVDFGLPLIVQLSQQGILIPELTL